MGKLQNRYFNKSELVARTTTADLEPGYEEILEEGDQVDFKIPYNYDNHFTKDRFQSLMYNKDSYQELLSFQDAIGAPSLSNFFKVTMDIAKENPTPIRNFPGDSKQVKITEKEQKMTAQGLNQWLTSAGLLEGNDKIRYEMLANEAMLPGTNMAVVQEQGSRQGITERFATQRQYTNIQIGFYVSADYKVLRLFQEWINFMNPLYVTQNGIKSPHAFPGGYPNNDEQYAYHRFRYPMEYKKNISITKFERNMGTGAGKGGRHNISSIKAKQGIDYVPEAISYNFVNAFPVSIQDIPLNYQAGQMLQCSVEFSYDRYYIVNNTGLPQKDTPARGGQLSEADGGTSIN